MHAAQEHMQHTHAHAAARTHGHTARPGIVSSRENEVFVGGTLFSCCVYFPRNNRRAAGWSSLPTKSNCLLVGTRGKKREGETRGIVTGGSEGNREG